MDVEVADIDRSFKYVLETGLIKEIQEEEFLRSELRFFISPNIFFFFMVFENGGGNRGSFFDELIDFEIVDNEFFVDGLVFLFEDFEYFMENA